MMIKDWRQAKFEKAMLVCQYYSIIRLDWTEKTQLKESIN